MHTVTVRLDDEIDCLVVASDIHAYRETLGPLSATIAALPGRVRVCFNGDLFEGGISPSEGVDWVREHAEGLAVRGNHDEWVLSDKIDGEYPLDTERGAYKHLSAEQMRFLRELPEVIEIEWRGKSIRVMHGHRTPAGEGGDWRWPPEKLIETFGDPDVDLVVTSHTHYACVVRQGERFYANSGSVAYPSAAIRNKDGSTHFQSGDPDAPENAEIRSSILAISEQSGRLDVEIVRFDYDREEALERLLGVDGAYTADFKTRLLREGVADLTAMKRG